MGFVCHELRAPLHALKVCSRACRGLRSLADLLRSLRVQGIISSMDKDSLPEDILCDLEFMDVSAQQMSLIINDVLDLVTVRARPRCCTVSAPHRNAPRGWQVQAGHQMAITPAWCDLRTAVKHARMFVDSYVQVPIVMVVHDDVPRQVWLDQLRFKQILLNGLSNACKLTTTGEITITVSLHAHARVRVDVRVPAAVCRCGSGAGVRCALTRGLAGLRHRAWAGWHHGRSVVCAVHSRSQEQHRQRRVYSGVYAVVAPWLRLVLWSATYALRPGAGPGTWFAGVQGSGDHHGRRDSPPEP